jgi:hypothetical protein
MRLYPSSWAGCCKSIKTSRTTSHPISLLSRKGDTTMRMAHTWISNALHYTPRTFRHAPTHSFTVSRARSRTHPPTFLQSLQHSHARAHSVFFHSCAVGSRLEHSSASEFDRTLRTFRSMATYSKAKVPPVAIDFTAHGRCVSVLMC